jgi:hypothetical protein
MSRRLAFICHVILETRTHNIDKNLRIAHRLSLFIRLGTVQKHHVCFVVVEEIKSHLLGY